ncbi:hypothetical protein BGW41_002579 [Actinomortierella wolfii]|nr:hypothetical protein BGW41_002579 [Actinomortierella wolfii]
MATAQTNRTAPLPAVAMAYAKYKNKFYVNGGRVKGGNTLDVISSQFFALDLSKPWRSDLPAWIPLPEGHKKEFIAATMSLDGKVFMTTPGIGYPAYLFSFEKNAWCTSKTTFRETVYDVDPATLGTDGTVLILGGFEEDKYDIYSFGTDQTVTMPLPEAKTTGLNRTLTDHCIAHTDDGKKLLTFGGSHTAASGAKVSSRELHILDLASGKWTRISFISQISQTEPLGGSLDVPSIVDFGKPSTPVAIYCISQDGWVDEYQPSPDYLNLVPTPPSGPSSSTAPTSPTSLTTPPTPGPSDNTASGNKLNIGVVAGGAAGAAVVIIAIGLPLWKRKKQGKRHSQQQGGPSLKADHPASAPDDIPKEAIHDARKTPLPLSHLEGPPASHYIYDFGNVNDGRYDHNLNTRHTTKPENSIPGSMPPRAGAPHYPSWGANFNSQYAYEAWVRANTAFGPEEATVSPNSPTYGTYIPPPPTLSYVPEDSTGRRNPQALGHRPVMERYDYSHTLIAVRAVYVNHMDVNGGSVSLNIRGTAAMLDQFLSVEF